MRWKKPITLAILGLGTVSLVALLFGRACPAVAKVAGIEPSGIFDDAGAEFWLVSINLSNQANAPIVLGPGRVRVEAKVLGHWVETPEQLRLSSIPPNESRTAQFLMPADAGACRLQFTYGLRQVPLDRWFSEWTWRKFPALYGSSSPGRALYRMYYSSLTNTPPTPRWRRLTTPELELSSPRAIAPDPLHNYPAASKTRTSDGLPSGHIVPACLSRGVDHEITIENANG